MSHNVLVVDPILRGSRLVNSGLAIAGFLKQGWTAHLLTRCDAVTEHYRELLDASSHHLHSTIPVPSEVWFDKLSPAVVQFIMDEINRLVAAHGITDIFFTGWNEFFPNLPLKVWRRTQRLSLLPCFAIDYAPGFWLKPRTTGLRWFHFRLIGKRAITRLALKRFGALKLLLLDERVLSEEASNLPAHLHRRYVWIPDPAPTPEWKPPQFRKLSTLPTVLVVGLQTERKGLIDVIELIESNQQNLPVRFHFVGRLAADTEHLRNRLKALPPPYFSWSEGFWLEQVIQRHYSEADFVILPYTRGFDCSSAVLATACGHGKPVVATDHGVIGYRVHHHNLGLVYATHNISKLIEILRQLPSPDASDYQILSANCRRFAQANSIEKYQKSIINLISEPDQVTANTLSTPV